MGWEISLGTLDLMAGAFYVDRIDTSTQGRVRMWLSIDGPTPKEIVDNVRLIEAQLNRAARQSQPASGSHWVTLDVRASANSTLVRYQVRRGRLTVPRDQVGGVPMSEGGYLPDVMVELECLEHTAGEPIELGPFEVSADNPTLFLQGIPGDEPALVEMRVRDLSDGAVINRIRVSGRSLDGMEEGDFNPVLPLTGNSMVEHEDSFNGYIASLSASQLWQPIGSTSSDEVPAGVHDVFGRVIDNSTPLAPPSLDSAVVSPGPYVVQSAGFRPAGSVTQVEVSFNALSRAGHALVALLWHGSDITAPSGWTHITTVGSPGFMSSVYYIPDATSRQSSGVFSQATAGPLRLDMLEIAGLHTSPLDRTATNAITTATSTHPTGTTATTQFAHELLLAFFGFNTLTTITSFTSGWTPVGSATGDVASVYARVVSSTGAYSATAGVSSTRTSRNAIVTFRAALSAPPELPAGEYTFWVTAYDSGDNVESAASLPIVVALNVPSAVTLSWAAPANGTFTSFRVYWKRDTNDTLFVDTGDTDTTFTLDSETDPHPDSPLDPPSVQQEGNLLRLVTGLESGVNPDPPTLAVSTDVAFGRAEPVYLCRTHLSPIAMPLAAALPGFFGVLQARRSSGNVGISADALFLMPSDEQQIAVDYTPADLDIQREWVFGTTPDLRSYAFLRDLSTGDEAGRLNPVGYCLLGPGDTTVVFLVTVEGGVWQIKDVEWDVSLTVVPQYRWLAGGV